MSDKEKRFNFKWLDKLKKIKHIEIYVAIIFVVILLLIYFSSFKKDNNTSSTINNELTITAYIDDLERSLEESLSQIGGVEDVKVMITLNMSQAEVSESNILLNKFPAINGVLVTAKGVGNTVTKLKVLHAIEAVLDVTNGNIQILSSD